MSDGSFSGGDIAAAMERATASEAVPSASPADDPSTAAAGASPAQDPATTAPAASTDGSPDTTKTKEATKTEEPKGPIPFEAHKSSLENARTKTRQEVESEYEWAKSIPEAHRETLAEFSQMLDAQPVEAIHLLIQQAAHDPQHAPALRSLFGRLLGNRGEGQSPAKSAPPALPEPDFEDRTSGSKFYSADRMRELAEAIEKRIDAKYAQKFGPIETDVRTRQHREAQAEALRTMQREADTFAERRYAQVKQWPHFEAHQTAIAEAMAKDESLEIGDAYIQVVVPKLSQQERSDVVASLQHKASAGSVNPAASPTSTQAQPKTFKEALERASVGAAG